jgi:hypothetical protein
MDDTVEVASEESNDCGFSKNMWTWDSFMKTLPVMFGTKLSR